MPIRLPILALSCYRPVPNNPSKYEFIPWVSGGSSMNMDVKVSSLPWLRQEPRLASDNINFRPGCCHGRFMDVSHLKSPGFIECEQAQCVSWRLNLT